MPVVNRIAAFAEDMKAWRHELHQMPELLLDTPLTAGFVAEKLKSFGVDEIHTGFARNGVIAIINGQGPGKTIGLRADMDALPIDEARDLPWKSRHPGRMHACGHDGHTTMLLGAARYLAETRRFSGRVALIFQPGEEGAGGARVMVEEGVIRRFGLSSAYALHNWPGLSHGQFGMRAGATMAAADVFTITVHGKGAHAAYPHLSVDPVNVAVQLVQAIQSVVPREVDSLDSIVISVTNIHAGRVQNVIPAEATITGTVRTLREELRQSVRARIERIAANLPQAFGATATVDYEIGYPVTVNDHAATEFASEVAASIVGEARVDTDRAPEMGAEDFSYFLQEIPGAYVFLGQGDTAGLHHPDYDFDDAIAPLGASYFARLAEMAQPVQG